MSSANAQRDGNITDAQLKQQFTQMLDLSNPETQSTINQTHAQVSKLTPEQRTALLRAILYK